MTDIKSLEQYLNEQQEEEERLHRGKNYVLNNITKNLKYLVEGLNK